VADQRLQPLEALYRFDDADIYLYIFISNGLMVLSYIYLYHIYVYIYIYIGLMMLTRHIGLNAQLTQSMLSSASVVLTKPGYV
jgi:hypothetical protein